jgi:hypothetical protein
MLWIEYEATEQIDIRKLEDILAGIASYIDPFPVAAFDRGKFGIGLVLSAICSETESNDDRSVSEIEIAQSRSSPGSSHVSWEVESDRPPLPSTPSSKSAQLSDGENGESIDATERTPMNDAGSDDISTKASSFSNTKVRSISHTRTSTRRTELRRGDDEDENSDADVDHPISDDSASPPVRKRNDRFSGTVTLQLSDTLKQELTISMGLHIRPVLGEDFADCKITLNPVQVMASSIFSDHDDDDLDSA